MRDQLVELFEGAFVEQQLDTLAGGELAFFMLPLAALGPTACFRGVVPAAQLFQPAHWHYCSAMSCGAAAWKLSP